MNKTRRQGFLTNKIMKIVCGGCFNFIHTGHIYFLKKCKGEKNKLGVILTNDKNNLKKTARPIKERIKNITNLQIADQIVTGDKSNPTKTIQKIKPDVICLGYDQKLPPGILSYVHKNKIKIKRISKLKNYQKRRNRFIGRILSDKKKGKLLLNIKRYKKKLKEELGEDFSSKILRLSLSRKGWKDLTSKDKLKHISGFEKGGKKQRSLDLCPVRIIIYRNTKNSLKLPVASDKITEKAWVVFSPKTSYNLNVIEIIRNKKLRKEFNLKDQDFLEVVF